MHCATWDPLATPSWAQRSHNMGNIASGEASPISNNVENTSENGHLEDFEMGRLCHHFETIWTSTWADQVGAKLGLEHSGSKLGRSWGLAGRSWPQAEPTLRRVGSKWSIWTIWGRSEKCANYHSPVHFLAACPWRTCPLCLTDLSVSLAAKLRCGRIFVSTQSFLDVLLWWVTSSGPNCWVWSETLKAWKGHISVKYG